MLISAKPWKIRYVCKPLYINYVNYPWKIRYICNFDSASPKLDKVPLFPFEIFKRINTCILIRKLKMQSDANRRALLLLGAKN